MKRSTWFSSKGRRASRPLGIDGGVPGAKGGEVHVVAALLIELGDEGDTGLCDGVGEFEAVVGGVVEALEVFPHVGAVVGEAGVLGDLLAEGKELVEDVFQRFAVGEAAVVDQLPGLLAGWAVGEFQEFAHLLEGVFLAAKGDGHGG